MKVIVLVAAFIGVVASELEASSNEPIPLFYHENVGIKEAARIKAAEEENVESRIGGGSPSSLGQFPWFGGLVITVNTGKTSVCGSSLISNTRAVTAAHCWYDGQGQASQFVVVLGSLTLFSGGTRIPTRSVLIHESWDPYLRANDVAVIAFSYVSYNNYIRPIALASGRDLYVGQLAWASGFGMQSDNSLPNGQSLHHVQLQVVPNAVCAGIFGSEIRDTNICVDGSNYRSTCKGDSGGPLAIISSGRPTLIGITQAVHASGCQRGFPAFFSRVTSYYSWIVARM